MRKQYLLKISGLAALTLLLLSPALAQDTHQNEEKDSSLDKPGKLEKFDEIIMRGKNDKDTKVTIEMKDGQVWVNGKTVSEFEDSCITIRKKKIRIMKGNGFSFSEPGEIEDLAYLKLLEAPDAPDAPLSPFRKHSGALNLEGANMAFLGVTSQKPEQEGTGAEVT